MKFDLIFLDLDGVIVDCALPAMKVFGADLNHERGYPSQFGWDIVGATNYIRGRDNVSPYPPRHITEKEFWQTLDFQWWADLKPFPWAGLFIKELEKYGEIRLATTPTAYTSCVGGKFKWIKKNLPQYLHKTHLSGIKTDFAQPGALLIDDSDINCENFNAAGGVSILVPRPWNTRGYHEQPYKVVLNELKEMTS